VLSVLLMSGPYPVEIVVAARDLAAMGHLIERDLYAIPGVAEWSPSLRLRVLKVEAGLAPFTALPDSPPGFPADGGLDATARGIIEVLWTEPRATNQQIAVRLGSSETTVRSRIADLRARGALRITAISNLRVGAGQAFAAVGIEVQPGRLDDVCRALEGFPEVRFAATVAGRCHILTMMVAPTPVQLAALAYEKLAGVRGVTRIELAQALRFVKHDYRWSPAVGAATLGSPVQGGPAATPQGR
jgi:Lrp/AsnC family transcriptional regulator for asnA, asnC and gidA